MNITAVVDNYPGYFDIPGPDLAFKMYEQLKGRTSGNWLCRC